MGNFEVGDVVKTVDSNADRLEGIVKHLTCRAATALGGKTCDRNTCNHTPKNHIWVKWPNEKLCSYNISELEFDKEGLDNLIDNMEDIKKEAVANNDVDAVARVGEAIKTISQSRRRSETQPAIKATTKATPMSSVDSNSWMEMFKADGTNAAYRVGAKQINNGVRNAIVEVMRKKGSSNDQIAGVAAFLETEWGSAIISMLSGVGLTYMPMLKDNPKAQRLAKEFRVGSMTTAGNEIFSAMIEQFLPVITGALNSLPEEVGSTVSQISEAPKSTEEKDTEEIEVDLTDLEAHLEEEEEKVVRNGS